MIDKRRKKRIKKGNKQSIKEMQIAVEKVVSEVDALERKEKAEKILNKMKFNREHLEEQTLQKIKEVNDEAGYRKYLEVPEMVNIIASIIEEKLKAWEACAENLVDYAHDFVTHLSTWGKGYDRNDRQIKLAEDAIAEYIRLKNENTKID